MHLFLATTTLSLTCFAAPVAVAQDVPDTPDVALAPTDLEPAPDLGLIGDIVMSDEEAFLDLAADAELTWELVLDALLELEYDIEAQLYRHPDESWIRVDDLWLAVEPVPYLSGEWSRVRVRVGDFITDIDRGWSEVLLLQIAHRFDERLLDTLIREAETDLSDDPRFVELGSIGDSWVDPGGVPHDLGSGVVPVSLDLTIENNTDCYDGYGYGGFSYWGSPWFASSYHGAPIATWGWTGFGGWSTWDVAFGSGLPLFWLGDPYGYHHHHHDPYHHHDYHDDWYAGYDDGAWPFDGPITSVDEFADDVVLTPDEGEIGTIVMDDPLAPSPRVGKRPAFIGRPETRRTTTIPIARRGPDTPSSVTRRTLYTPQGTRIITLEAPRRPSLPPITTSPRSSDPVAATPVGHGERGTPIFGAPREEPSAGIGMPSAPSTGGWTTVTSSRSPRVIVRPPSSGSSSRTSTPKTSSRSTPKTSSPRSSPKSAPKSSTSRKSTPKASTSRGSKSSGGKSGARSSSKGGGKRGKN